MNLCICGVCIPYSMLLPAALLLVKQVYDLVISMFLGTKPEEKKLDKTKNQAKGEAISSECSCSTDNINTDISTGQEYILEKDETANIFENLIKRPKTIVRFTAKW